MTRPVPHAQADCNYNSYLRSYGYTSFSVSAPSLCKFLPKVQYNYVRLKIVLKKQLNTYLFR